MTIDQLKTEWKRFNQKLAASQRLNDELISSMLRERSRSRVAKIRRENVIYMVLMITVLAFIGGIFAGNPFDFSYAWQYIPYGVLAIGVLLAIGSLVNSLMHFRVDLNKVNLDSFLKATIEAYRKSQRMQAWFGSIMFAAGTLTVLSFFPKKLDNKGLWPAIGETAVMVGIVLIIYFVAFKLGAFKDRKKDAFEADWKELNQLKAISSDLANETV